MSYVNGEDPSKLTHPWYDQGFAVHGNITVLSDKEDPDETARPLMHKGTFSHDAVYRMSI